ncbi:protein kinase domain-containing protein [Actinosynnema sp.]|uniref:protein kinase domain-containing protein n=1 Tax=Actinosynnema sp. TaxID=1872144 RepID=UPI003F838676
MQPLHASDPVEIGRYRLTGRLGSGGMGSVYLGRSPGGRLAAVKVINLGFQEDPNALERFRREVETLRTVRSAYTAALIDSETTTPPCWFATEYVPGPTLASAIKDEGGLPPDLCRALLAALAEGLADIHAHGVWHRDVKPQNVILSATGPQLIDFGIARATEQTALTQQGLATGSPGYIAPEVLTDDAVGPAADVFALGATIARAATGRPPFGDGNAYAITYRTVQADIDLDGVEPGLAALITACTDRDPARRPDPHAIIERCQPAPPLVEHPAYRRALARSAAARDERTDVLVGPPTPAPSQPVPPAHTPPRPHPAQFPQQGAHQGLHQGPSSGPQQLPRSGPQPTLAGLPPTGYQQPPTAYQHRTDQPHQVHHPVPTGPQPAQRRPGALAAVAAVAVLALAGGGLYLVTKGKGAGQAGAPPTSATSQPGDAGQPPASASDVPDGNRCTTAQLTMAFEEVERGGRVASYRLVFTNTSNQECVLNGFPGVSLRDGDNAIIGDAAGRVGGPKEPVTLVPGTAVQADVIASVREPGDDDEGCWEEPVSLVVFPPASKSTMTVRTKQPVVCGDRFTVGAVYPVQT